MRNSTPGESVLTFMAGMAAGAAIMYIIDPVAGARRRAIVRDKARATAHHAEDRFERKSKDLKNRTMGATAELRGRVRESGVDDRTLIDRVRSQLGTVSTHPRAITVTASDGCVMLSGDILQNEVESVRKTVENVRGVKEVRNYLRSHETAGSLPQLQGQGRVAD